MVKMYYEQDADAGLIARRKVAVIGKRVRDELFEPEEHPVGDYVRIGGVPFQVVGVFDTRVMPDQVQASFYSDIIAPRLNPGDALLFAHGFSIHFDFITPPPDVDVAMVAPKGPGHLVRRQFVEGSGVPTLVAVHQDATGGALDLALSYANAIGGTRAGVIETTFAEETETDLFGEQVILCGGVSAMIQASFDTLVDAGYEPEMAYFEVLHELKLIVDLLFEGGIEWMRHSVSDTAEYGDITRGPRVVGDATKAEMAKILGEIQSGEFAREWMAEYEAGSPNLIAAREAIASHPVEVTGKRLRDMMTFMVAKTPDDDV